jgi:CDP-glucose 4,6-dehydratase
MFEGYYAGKKVLVTGHTGFKGSWLSLWLKELGAQVWGLALPAPTQPNLYEVIRPGTFIGEIICDIRDRAKLAEAIKRIRPDVLLHLAAQPLVRLSYAEPIETFETNTLGTANLLEAVRGAELGCPVVVVTSDKCYENREWEFAYRENDPMGGHDIYSMSKGAAELVAHAWYRSFFIPNPKLGPMATARAGNVIGGGDYAADRIVPDCIRALIQQRPIVVRNPRAVRPWQHVLECLSGYLWLGARLSREAKTSQIASPFNFGPPHASRQPVQKLVEEVLQAWPGSWVDQSDPGSPHEAVLLSLSIEKAGALLQWHPTWGFEEAVRQTVSWYRARHTDGGADLLELTRQQIRAYATRAAEQGQAWAR